MAANHLKLVSISWRSRIDQLTSYNDSFVLFASIFELFSFSKPNIPDVKKRF
jgi:hypothetical protein